MATLVTLILAPGLVFGAERRLNMNELRVLEWAFHKEGSDLRPINGTMKTLDGKALLKVECVTPGGQVVEIAKIYPTAPKEPVPQIGKLELKLEYWYYMVEAAKETGVPAAVLAGVAAIESRFVHDHPKGKDRVIGLMNIQEDVAQAMGLDPYDPWENVLAGARILKRLIKQRGSLIEALKKYNPKWTPSYIREVVKAVAQAEETTKQGIF